MCLRDPSTSLQLWSDAAASASLAVSSRCCPRRLWSSDVLGPRALRVATVGCPVPLFALLRLGRLPLAALRRRLVLLLSRRSRCVLKLSSSVACGACLKGRSVLLGLASGARGHVAVRFGFLLWVCLLRPRVGVVLRFVRACVCVAFCVRRGCVWWVWALACVLVPRFGLFPLASPDEWCSNDFR